MSALGLAGAILGLAGLVAGLMAVLWSQLRKNTTQIVRDENADLYARNATLERRVDEAVRSEADCSRRLAELEATTRKMADLLTGAAAVSELSTLVAFQHDEVVRILGIIEQHIARRREP